MLKSQGFFLVGPGCLLNQAASEKQNKKMQIFI